MLDVVSGLLQMHIRPLWRSKWDYTSFGWVWKVNINVEFRRWQLRSCTRLASEILVGVQRGLLGGSLPDRGRYVGSDPAAKFVVTGSYFGREWCESEEERAGLTMNFAWWSQPLENYVAALGELVSQLCPCTSQFP
jgi:hypothetical protein